MEELRQLLENKEIAKEARKKAKELLKCEETLKRVKKVVKAQPNRNIIDIIMCEAWKKRTGR